MYRAQAFLNHHLFVLLPSKMAAVTDFAAWEADFAKAFLSRGSGSRTHFGYGYAKLGTSVCKDVECKTNICKGELRIVKDAPNRFALDDTLSRSYYHPECFFLRVMPRAHKWHFEQGNELENYSVLTADDRARVEGLVSHANLLTKSPKEKKDDKLAARQEAAAAKFEKAQAKAKAKQDKAEALAAKKAQPKPEVTPEQFAKDEARRAKARAYYQARKAKQLEYEQQWRDGHAEMAKLVSEIGWKNVMNNL